VERSIPFATVLRSTLSRTISRRFSGSPEIHSASRGEASGESKASLFLRI
jgi:hypothetical protein